MCVAGLSSHHYLAIDGGGVRGVVSARILVEIEKRTGKAIANIFTDGIAGTSAGSIIATGLSCPDSDGNPKFTAQKIFEIFENEMSKVFHESYIEELESLGGLRSNEFKRSGLDKLLEETLGTTQLSEALSPLCITSTALNQPNSCFLFTSAKNPDVLMQDAVKASSAAPPYFPTYPLRLNNVDYLFGDGGFWGNNPALCLYILNNGVHDKTKNMSLVSIGTGHTTTKIPLSESHAGGIYWLSNVLPVMFSGIASCVNDQMNYLMPDRVDHPGDRLYCRLDPEIALKNDDITNTEPSNIKELIQSTEKYLDEEQDTIEKLCRQLYKP